MIREAILVTFVAVDIYKTVANGRRKRRASEFPDWESLQSHLPRALLSWPAVTLVAWNGHSNRHAGRAQQEYLQQRSQSTLLATAQTSSNTAVRGRTKLVSLAAMGQEQLFQLLGLCTFFAAAVLTGKEVLMAHSFTTVHSCPVCVLKSMS